MDEQVNRDEDLSCSGARRRLAALLADPQFRGLAPEKLSALCQHVIGCDQCATVFTDAWALNTAIPQLMRDQVASDPQSILRLLSPQARVSLRQVLLRRQATMAPLATPAIQPPSGVPPILARVWERERCEEANRSSEGIDSSASGEASAVSLQRGDGPAEATMITPEATISEVSEVSEVGADLGYAIMRQERVAAPSAHDTTLQGPSVGAIAQLNDATAPMAAQRANRSPFQEKLAAVHRVSETQLILNTALDRADDANWQAEQDYSVEAAQMLTQAYDALKAKDYQSAFHLIVPWRERSVSAHQLLCLNYGLGQSLAAYGQYPEALVVLEDSLELGLDLGEFGACVLLAYLHGAINIQQEQYSAATEYYEIAFQFLQELSGDNVHVDVALELEMLMRLATTTFFSEQYTTSQSYLEQARHLVTLPKTTKNSSQALQVNEWVREDAAAVEWMEALLLRWSGQPDRALTLTLSAAEVYNALGKQDALGRISIVAADCALDRAAAYPARSLARQSYLSMANPYIRRSLALLRAEGDQTGAAMASLARVRYERLAEKQTHRMSVIREVARLAERLNDLPLLAQAYTAFGDEFMSADQRLEARLYYLKTLEALEHSDAPALGVWARRGLLRAAEMSL